MDGAQVWYDPIIQNFMLYYSLEFDYAKFEGIDPDVIHVINQVTINDGNIL